MFPHQPTIKAWFKNAHCLHVTQTHWQSVLIRIWIQMVFDFSHFPSSFFLEIVTKGHAHVPGEGEVDIQRERGGTSEVWMWLRINHPGCQRCNWFGTELKVGSSGLRPLGDWKTVINSSENIDVRTDFKKTAWGAANHMFCNGHDCVSNPIWL